MICRHIGIYTHTKKLFSILFFQGFFFDITIKYLFMGIESICINYYLCAINI